MAGEARSERWRSSTARRASARRLASMSSWSFDMKLRPGGDGRRDGAQDTGDDASGADVVGAIEHLAEDLFHRFLGTIAPVAADSQVDGDFIVVVIAGTNLVIVGAGEDFDAGLKAAVIAEGDGNGGLHIHGAGAFFIEQACQGGIGIEAFEDDVVVIAAEREIESEEHFEVLDFKRADAQVIGSEIEQEAMELEGIVERRRIDVAADQPAGFEAHPAIASGAAVFLEIEIAVVVSTELPHGGEFLLHTFEKVENGLAVVGKIQLRVDAHVDVEILAERCIRIRHDSPLPIALARSADHPCRRDRDNLTTFGRYESSAVLVR